MPPEATLASQIRDLLAQFGQLPVDVASIGADEDLFRAGLTSHASVNVMLGLESKFDVEFPDAMLQRSTFESITAMESALRALLPGPAAS